MNNMGALQPCLFYPLKSDPFLLVAINPVNVYHATDFCVALPMGGGHV